MAPADPSDSGDKVARSRGSLVTGSVWMVTMRWAIRLVGLGSTIVLARILTPDDFGVVAMAMIVVALLETATYAGVDLALIRERNMGREECDTAWTIQLFQGGVIALLLFAVAPLTNALFSDPRAVLVIQWMALKAVLDSFQNIGVVTFRRDLDFAREFRFNVLAKIASTVLTIGAALALRNYWALVVGLIGGSVVNLLLSYTMHPYRPRLSLARTAIFWRFSFWLLVARVGAFLRNKLDAVFLGNSHGAAALGSYHMASELATMPVTEVVMPMRRALFPGLAALSGDKAQLRETVLQSFGILALLCAALGFGLSACSKEVVELLLGSQWRGIVPLVQWLAIFGAISGISGLVEVLLWIDNRTAVSAAINWLETILLVPLLFVALKWYGAEGVAISRCIAAAGILFASMPLIDFLRDREILSALGRPFAAAIVMAVLLEATAPVLVGPIFVILAQKVIFGALIYGCALFLIWVALGRPRGAERTVISLLGNAVSAVRHRLP